MEYSYGSRPSSSRSGSGPRSSRRRRSSERYFNHVADRFDLRRDIQLGTRVTAATYDDAGGAVAGRHRSRRPLRAQFLVMATGCLSAPLEPQIPGRESFAGISLTRRVAAGSTRPHGQARRPRRHRLVGRAGDPESPRMPQLYVFQRTPSYAWPAGNKPLDADLQAKVKEQYRELRAEQRRNYGGVVRHERRGARCPCRATSPSSRPRRGTSGGGRRARLGGVPGAGATCCATSTPTSRRRALPRDDPARHRRPRDRRRPLAATTDRVQAADPAHRLLRDLQPRPRAPGRPAARWHRGDHARRHPRPRRASSSST